MAATWKSAGLSVVLGAWACGTGLAEVPKPDGAVETKPPAPIETRAPDGYCAFDPAAPKNTGIRTGFKPGLEKETQLVAMFVPCAALEHAWSGQSNWLPDWVAIETNTVTKPEDDDRIVGTRGAVALLCKDAQTRHTKIAAETFTAKAEMAHKGLSNVKPIIYFGVVGEDEGVCYMSSLRFENDGTNVAHRLLSVFAFMLAGDRWIYLSTTRETPDATTAAEVLALAQSSAAEFMRLNP